MACCHCGHSLQWRHNEQDSVSNHQPHNCLLNRLFRPGSNKTSKLRVTGLCAGNSPGTGEFPAQMASDAENASIWWRHHVLVIGYRCRIVQSSHCNSFADREPVDINYVFLLFRRLQMMTSHQSHPKEQTSVKKIIDTFSMTKLHLKLSAVILPPICRRVRGWQQQDGPTSSISDRKCNRLFRLTSAQKLRWWTGVFQSGRQSGSFCRDLHSYWAYSRWGNNTPDGCWI